MARDNDFGAYLAGFIIGGLVGAAAALLLAPQSGEETRTQIREKSIEIRDKASASMDDLKVKTNEQIEAARVRVEGMAQQVQQKTSGVSLSMSSSDATTTEEDPDKLRHD